MATENEARGTIEVTSIGADWDWGSVMTSYANEVNISSITFVPGSANDKLVIKEDSASGPTIFHALCLIADEKIKYYHGAKKSIYVYYSDCVHNTGHKMIIDLWPARR